VVLLVLLRPHNVTVPDVVGKSSAFEAEKTLVAAGLKLAPQTAESVSGEAPALRDVAFSHDGGKLAIANEETVAILGANGAGKSTLLRVAGGLRSPDDGRFLLDGRSATGARTSGASPPLCCSARCCAGRASGRTSRPGCASRGCRETSVTAGPASGSSVWA
jgi:hypothetical protein